MKKWSFLIWFLSFSSTLFAQNLQWKEFQTNGKASLRGLSPVSALVCWASGSKGTWLKTLDGGSTWEEGTIAGLDTVDFRSIHAFDAKTAVVASAGQPAVIYRTEDGGASWTKVHQEGGEDFFDAISFVDKKRGYVVGDPVGGKWMVLETLDGGRSWHTLASLPDALEGEAAFAASSSSMVTEKKNLFLATGGSASRLHTYSFSDKSWSVADLAGIAQKASAKGVFAMTRANGRLMLVGGDYTLLEDREGNSLIWENGKGRIPGTVPFGYRSGLAFTKKKNLLIAVGPAGSDASYDAGDTWVNFSKTGFHAVKTSSDGKAIWASGSQGRLGLLGN